jgi:hypothetical protein
MKPNKPMYKKCYHSLLFLVWAVTFLCTASNAWGAIIPEGTPAKDFYGGASAAYVSSNAPSSNNDGSVTGISTDQTDVAGKVYAGVNVTDNVALEVTYQDFGSSSFSATSSGGPSWSAGAVSTKHEADGFSLSAITRVPLKERHTLLLRLGWLWWHSKESYTESSGPSISENSGSDLTIGIGLEYDPGLLDRIVYRTEIEQHRVDDASYDLTTASFGICYRFP